MTLKISLILAVSALASPAPYGAAIEPEGGLVVCIGGAALEDVSDQWGRADCLFHCLETSEAEIVRLRGLIRAAE